MLINTVLKKSAAWAFARKSGYRIILAWVLAFLVLPLVTSVRLTPVLAETDPGTIAYVRPSDVTGDQIRLIEPDGSNDRLIWETGTPVVEGLVQVSSLAWNPAANDLAFASYHEETCSFYSSDIYDIHADGSGYRRVTAGPECGQNAGLPTGTVQITVENRTEETGPFFVYFQGAPAPKSISLDPGTQTTLTFTDVADYGDFKQWGVAVFDKIRYFTGTGDADVLAGKTVTAGTLSMDESYTNWGWAWPTWTGDGSRISYIFNADTPYWIEADNTKPGMTGSLVFNVPIGQYPYDPKFFTWAPPGPRADQVLYSVWDSSNGDTSVYLGTAGSDSPGEALFSVGDGLGHAIFGLAWLPDSSGFLFSKTGGWNEYANIYEYNFQTQQTTQLTDITSGWPRRLSVSPDGRRAVYEYQPNTGGWTDLDIDLWILDLDTGESTLFVENGRTPAWSPQAISVPDPDPQPVPPVAGNNYVYLPMVIRQ